MVDFAWKNQLLIVPVSLLSQFWQSFGTNVNYRPLKHLAYLLEIYFKIFVFICLLNWSIILLGIRMGVLPNTWRFAVILFALKRFHLVSVTLWCWVETLDTAFDLVSSMRLRRYEFVSLLLLISAQISYFLGRSWDASTILGNLHRLWVSSASASNRLFPRRPLIFDWLHSIRIKNAFIVSRLVGVCIDILHLWLRRFEILHCIIACKSYEGLRVLGRFSWPQWPTSGARHSRRSIWPKWVSALSAL